MLTELFDAVVGVDTHRDTHEVEIATVTGVTIARTQIENSTAGFSALLVWVAQHSPGPRVVVSMEGTRSFGIGLNRALTAAGILVLECEQPSRKLRHGKGKSDQIDAHLAVLAALRLPVDQLPQPRADGDREALRILLGARTDLSVASTAQTNRLRSLLLSGDDQDRRIARGALTDDTLAALTRRRGPRQGTREQHVRAAELRRLAGSLRDAARQLKSNATQIRQIVDELAPGLTARLGIGPISAAQVLLAFSHPGRCRDDAAFASLAGVSPLPASSGQKDRHRLNRGGDRALNKAIHTIAITRIRTCPRTKEYIARRTAEGKTKREIRRCLKRYIARELYRTLTSSMAVDT